MKTKAEYLTLAEGAISEYPQAALLYQAKDPRLMALLGAMSAMLSLHSQEQDVQASEPFDKVRDVTVLADAAAKGVLPLGQPYRARLAIQNVTATAFSVKAGRRVLDPQGRVHVVTVGADVPANGTATVQTVQQVETVTAHTVTTSKPFYMIPVSQPETGSIVEIKVADQFGNDFTYQPSLTNTELGARSFTLETDENRTLKIVFGAANIGGYQPAINEVLSITVISTEGNITLSAGAPFVFEYATTTYDSGAKVTLDSVVSVGSDPMTIETLREITSYPSLYDDAAVFLGNFDVLIRKNIGTFRFLSVWNERLEETVRSPSVDNMNTLFVAALKDGVEQAELEAEIKRVILRADDSYRVRFVPAVRVEIPVQITLQVPSIYDDSAVKQAAIEQILGQYGENTAWAQRGRGRVLYRKISTLLQSKIQACQAETSDIYIKVTDADTILPESYRYVSAKSLSVTVETSE